MGVLNPKTLLIFLIFGLALEMQAQDVIWHVKAMHPEGYTLDVKAFDDKGNIYDVKAIEEAEQSYIMEVRAFVKNEKIPVKVLVSEDQYKPLMAIDSIGQTYVLKAIWQRASTFL